jgi:hypothetical protein
MNLAPEKTLNDFQADLAEGKRVYLLSALEYKLAMADALRGAREQPKLDLFPVDPRQFPQP